MLVRASAALRRALSLRLGLRSGERKLSGEKGDNQAATVATTCFPLESRALLRLRGPEAATFLQGLMTNDVTLLTQEGGGASLTTPRALYAHALNVQGRCLYDVMLYRIHRNSQEEPHLLLECDAAALDPLQKHLKLYKIRRKVDITPCLDLCLWAVLPEGPSEEASQKLQQCASKVVVATPDPRVDIMGWRLIASQGTDPLEIVPGSQIGNMKDYHRHRHPRRSERPALWSCLASGVQRGLLEWHQFHQGLLHWPGANGQDPPYGCHPETPLARTAHVSSSSRRSSRRSRNTIRIGKAGWKIPCRRGRVWDSAAAVGPRPRTLASQVAQ
nr:putative transferase CAF17, mitochondrial isoform X2 [Anolis sagrei ordinatus]